MSIEAPALKYKDSKIEWLGLIPDHWQVKKISWYFRATKGKSGQLLTKEYCSFNEGAFPVYSGQTENSGVMGSIGTYEFDVGESGVLFSTTVGAKAMNLAHLVGKFSLSQNCMIIEPIVREVHTRFFYFNFQPLFRFERELIPDHMQASFRIEDLYDYKFCIPPLIEQQKIANFLDHETAKIDTLIEKQQQLIKLLKEKRQAVINYAVTKGLNPDAPMKDSGVEWLGEVPEGWVVRRLKSLIESGTSISYGIVQPGDRQDDGVPFIQTTNISRGDFDIQNLDKTTSEIAGAFPRSKLSGGEVILGIRASIGAAYVVPEHLKGANLSRGIARIAPSKSLLSEFLVDYLRSQVVFDYWGLGSQGSTFSEVSIDTVKELFVVVPPLSEQKEICSYISRISRVYESLMDRATELNQLQKERRTALISAAVTGKIDVRNWQPPKATSTTSTDA